MIESWSFIHYFKQINTERMFILAFLLSKIICQLKSAGHGYVSVSQGAKFFISVCCSSAVLWEAQHFKVI